MPAEQIFCSVQSLSFDEPLYATAPLIENWILLEYRFPFSAKAFEDSSLPQDVKTHLSEALESLPHSRLLMIKKGYESVQTGFNLFLAHSAPQTRWAAHYRLNDYTDLLDIDLKAVASPSERLSNPASDPLFLVCTNGKRDLCCARNGLPVYPEMQKYAAGDAWQSSHMGGHRFAANAIFLPYGIYYGRLAVSEVEHFVTLSKTGQIDLKHYRGRTCYTEPQQAAEYFLRQHTGNTLIDDLRLIETTNLAADQWQVQFESASAGGYQVGVRRKLSDYSVIESCSSPEKARQQSIYSVIEVRSFD